MTHSIRKVGTSLQAPSTRKPTDKLAVSLQEVVHSALTEEAEVAEASDSEGRTEWTPIRMSL
jgi:hypothetical protein